MSSYVWELTIYSPYSLEWRYTRDGDAPLTILSFSSLRSHGKNYLLIDFSVQPIYISYSNAGRVREWFRKRRIEPPKNFEDAPNILKMDYHEPTDS